MLSDWDSGGLGSADLGQGALPVHPLVALAVEQGSQCWLSFFEWFRNYWWKVIVVIFSYTMEKGLTKGISIPFLSLYARASSVVPSPLPGSKLCALPPYFHITEAVQPPFCFPSLYQVPSAMSKACISLSFSIQSTKIEGVGRQRQPSFWPSFPYTMGQVIWRHGVQREEAMKPPACSPSSNSPYCTSILRPAAVGHLSAGRAWSSLSVLIDVPIFTQIHRDWP